MERITIVGMGPLGTAIGLALKRARLPETEIVGTGRDRARVAKAHKMGALDRTAGLLGSAVDGAQLIILDTELEETRELLEALGQVLGQGCVITDTGGAKTRVMEWANELLPKGISFVGGRPLPRRALVDQEDADASAFEGAPYCVVAAPSTSPSAVKTVTRLAETMGATPFFLDAREHDSYSTAMTGLPVILASALVNSVASGQTWKEMARLASAEFREASRLVSLDPRSIDGACKADPDSVVLWLDRVIEELQAYRTMIKDGSDQFVESMIRAWEVRARWEHGAIDADERRPEIPTSGQAIGTMFLGDRLLRRQREMADRERRRKWTYPRGRR